MPDTQGMDPPAAEYDARYLAGILRFNRGDYFDAHEVWEELWHDCPAADRRFYQSLIQAAVALYHWGNGNRAGAARLFDSGRRYMAPYRPNHRGLAVDPFWADVEGALSQEPNPAAPFPGRSGVRGQEAGISSEQTACSSSPPRLGEGPGEGLPSKPPNPPTPFPKREGGAEPGEGFFPQIDLSPAPAQWPDPDEGV